MHEKGFVLTCFGVPVQVPGRLFGTPDGRSLNTSDAGLGHAEAVRPLHAKMHGPVCTPLLSFRPPSGGASETFSAHLTGALRLPTYY